MSSPIQDQYQELVKEEEEHLARPVPEPPFTSETPYGEGHTVGCFFPGCSKNFSTYYQLMNHIKNSHSVNPTAFKDSYFLGQYRAEYNNAQSKRRAKKPTPKAGEAGAKSFWKPAFVRVNEHGAAIEPFEIKYTIPTNGTEWQNTEIAAAQPQPPPEVAPAERPSSGHDVVPRHEHAPSPAQSHQAPAIDDTKKKSASRETLALLKEHFAIGWEKAIPAVAIKVMDKDAPLPLKKGEGTLRARWPKPFPLPHMQLLEFTNHLERTRLHQEAQRGDHLRGIKRFCSLLQCQMPDCEWDDVNENTIAADTGFLVGCLQSNIHESLFDLPILDYNYGWSGKMLEALLAFCKWQSHALDGKIVAAVPGPWPQHKAAIARLVDILEGGYMKRWKLVKEDKIQQKYDDDRETIKTLPSPAKLKAAVEQGFVDLLAIRTEAAHQNPALPLPRRTQGMANACVVGAFWLDMFGGRKKEIEDMTLAQVDKMFDEGKDFLVCSKHKTSRTYGSLAKWLSPGVRAAFDIYRKLPRDPAVKTFLVPACEGTAHVSVPQALSTFCAQKIKHHKGAKPTVNLMRKFFHGALVNATKDEEGLKRLMVILDGHAAKTIDRHYFLRDPADDVKLAKILVKWVLGKTARFPDNCPAHHLSDELVESYFAAAKPAEQPSGDEDSDADDEEDELAWWPNANFFGFGDTAPALQDENSQAADNAPGSSHSPTNEGAVVQIGDHIELGVDTQESAHEVADCNEGKRALSCNPGASNTPPQKRGRKGELGEDAKAWLREQQQLYCSWSVAPNMVLREWLKEGIGLGKFTDSTTTDQLRHVCKHITENYKAG